MSDVFEPNALLGGTYRILRLLGEGGAGTVYEARHETLGHHTAIKVLFPHLARNAELRARFVDEAQIQAQLRHPNLVSVVDIIDDGAGLVASVMDFIEGRSLSDWIEEHRPTDQVTALRFARGLLTGLGFAHERGIVHRDVKPDNVLLDTTGPEPVPKLTDFGIAKVLAADKRTRTGTKMGTVAYMAPEQAEDSALVDARADIYSVGITLYELFTGTLPFESDNMFALLKQHRKAAVPPPSSRRPDLLPGLESVILRALEKDPERRFASCQAILQALEGLENRGDSLLPAGVTPLSMDDYNDTAPHAPVGGAGAAVTLEVEPIWTEPSAAPLARPPTPAPLELVRLPPAARPPRARMDSQEVTRSASFPPPLGARPSTWRRKVWRWGWLLVIGLTLYQAFPFGHCMWEAGQVYRQTRANDPELNLDDLARLRPDDALRIGASEGFGEGLSRGFDACKVRAGFGAGHPAWIGPLLGATVLGLLAIWVTDRLARQASRVAFEPASPPPPRRRLSEPRRALTTPLEGPREPLAPRGRALLRLEGAASLPAGRDLYVTLTAQGLDQRALAQVHAQVRAESHDGHTLDVWEVPRSLTTLATAVAPTAEPFPVPFVIDWAEVHQALKRNGVEPMALRAVVVRVGFRGEGLLYRVRME